MSLKPLGLLVALGLLGGCASQDGFHYVPPPQTLIAPEAASGWIDKPGWQGRDFMVAAANPLAVDAGYQIIKAGGSAVDAAIAVQLVLTLVEPQSSGIGGGSLMLVWDGKQVAAVDGRETAPAAATDQLFMKEGKPMAFYEGVVGGRSVGAPGTVRALALAHERYGKLPWATLFEPAITLAEQGFVISPRLATLLAKDPYLAGDPDARAYFYQADGTPKTAGTRLTNPALARVLRTLASDGPDAFYRGPLAEAMVAKVHAHPTNPGVLSAADLASYQAKLRDGLCFDYRQSEICGFPTPSSGTIALGQIFGMLESRDMAALKPVQGEQGQLAASSEAIHLYSEAARLAFADRNQYVADVVDVPVTGLLDKGYLAQRGHLIGNRSMGVAQPGNPPRALARGRDATPELPSTSHISIVDKSGMAVAMTSSIEDGFGSRLMVNGYLLNNQLTDFSFTSVDAAGLPVANRVEPGKRPRSSMSPLLVFDKASGELEMSLGSPGGSAIINYVGKALLGTQDWGLDLQQAINLPNFGSRNGPTELEQGRTPDAVVQGLKARGHEVLLNEQTSGLQGVQRHAGGWLGAADPRREGVARGE
ncbi:MULTISPECIES: gamma-glutamyltransferase family protein [Aeromonas]|nr:MULTISPECIES: gamma-glutamyltransferase family protein [Aeromonas]MDU7310027.1 gamma-glutamyltransferase family protein [Aeromonas sp.]KDV02283.1 gamma-glutamyltransferase [Aeromonas sp. HZM]MBL0437684.1 gamma-glutamyltransferase family protein [Aeromonas caviae]MBL0537506.1 gamma-glutamyltransferase family protein [Aeromonas caviae]MBL0582981.1 gamma-glutamyltransferase family protein [Aeromonas caviae]